MKKFILIISMVSFSVIGCVEKEVTGQVLLDDSLPTIGLLVFEGFLTTEVTAPLEVFKKHSSTGEKLFNVVTIAEKLQTYISEEGLRVIPDLAFSDTPQLDVLIVPSSYDFEPILKKGKVVEFIKEQDKQTKYTVSNCAGAYLLGEAGVAKGKKIVTYIGGKAELQKKFPELLVQNDSLISYMEDGKIISSNGNLASYISSLMLLEKLSNKSHKEYVESQIYLERLQSWED